MSPPVQLVPKPAAASPLAIAHPPLEFTDSALSILRVAAGFVDLLDYEFQFFIEMCKARCLNPFARQIYAIVRGGKDGKPRSVTYQTSIDGFRALAERTGRYEGQLGPYWCGGDGMWRDVWLERQPPAAAKVGILRTGFREPLKAIALHSNYYQGGGLGLWDKMPENQLAKCAEALGLRRAFPEPLGGLYVREEMDQANVIDTPALVDERTNVHPVTVAATATVRTNVHPSTVTARDVPPEPGSKPAAMTVDELAAVQRLEAECEHTKTEAEIVKWRTDARRAGGKSPTETYKTWQRETAKKAYARLGIDPGKPGPAKAAPTTPSNEAAVSS